MKFDPNATSEFKLLIDDEIPQYVTIEELQELLKQKAYQTTQDKLILSQMNKERRVEALMPPGFTLFPYWISSHLLVQTCMQDFEAYDWAKITDVYNIPRIAEIAFIASHPYVWQPIEERPLDTIISGKIATMQFDSSRCSIKWLDKMVNERVLFLADHRPSALQDTYLNGEGNVLKGMLFWNLIVTDGRVLQKMKISYISSTAGMVNEQMSNVKCQMPNVKCQMPNVLDLICGRQRNPLPDFLRNHIADCISRGGKVLLSTDHFSVIDDKWAKQNLHTSFYASHATRSGRISFEVPEPTGAAGAMNNRRSRSNYKLLLEPNEEQLFTCHPEGLKPENGAFRVAEYQDMRCTAAVGYTNPQSGARTLVFGFPLEAVISFETLYRRSISWLLEK